MKKFFLLIFLSIGFNIYSQQIVHRPLNPFLGGSDSFRYQQLLASANAQNDFEEGNANANNQNSSIENFTENLNRQLLNSLSQSLFQQQIGTNGLSIGTTVFGSLVVEVTPALGGLSISILDTSTGEQTQITIPNN